VSVSRVSCQRDAELSLAPWKAIWTQNPGSNLVFANHLVLVRVESGFKMGIPVHGLDRNLT
jgi:hypothetical protein